MKYEVHLTVDGVVDYNIFKRHCELINIKPIFLHLHTTQSKINDIMTSSIHNGDDDTIKDYCKTLYTKLMNYGYNIIRTKVETPPFHPSCPTDLNGLMHGIHNYYETHLPVICNDVNKLIELCHNNDVHVSKNIFKKHDDGEVYMVTIRNKLPLEQFIAKFNILKHLLVSNGYEILNKHHIEFCLYDSNISHDDAWILKKN